MKNSIAVMNACNTTMHRSVSKSAHMLLKDTCPKKAETPGV